MGKQWKVVVALTGVLCLLVVLVTLGGWQWHKYQYKQKIEHMLAERKQLVPVSLSTLGKRMHDNLLYIPVALTGSVDNAHTFLWDNQVVNRRVGFRVFSPVKLTSGAYVLIDRGWVSGNMHRKTLPVVPEIVGVQHFSGLLWRPAGNAFLLNKDAWVSTWPKVIQAIDIKKMAQAIGHSVLPWMVVLNADQPGVFLRQAPVLPMASSRHMGYAVQWWLMAVALVILCVFFVWRGRQNRQAYDGWYRGKP